MALTLSTTVDTYGQSYFGSVLGKTVGSSLAITTNPGNRWRLINRFLTCDGFQLGDIVSITETASDKTTILGVTSFSFSQVGGPSSLSVSGAPSGGTFGSSGSFTPAVSGGVAPYALSAGGQLPPGRSVSGNSVVGTYLSTGPFAYFLLVTDSVGAQVRLPIQETVSASSLPSGLAITATPKLTGVRVSGEILTVDGYSFAHAPANVRIQMTRDGSAIAGAVSNVANGTAITYVQNTFDVGHQIGATVTALDGADIGTVLTSTVNASNTVAPITLSTGMGPTQTNFGTMNNANLSLVGDCGSRNQNLSFDIASNGLQNQVNIVLQCNDDTGKYAGYFLTPGGGYYSDGSTPRTMNFQPNTLISSLGTLTGNDHVRLVAQSDGQHWVERNGTELAGTRFTTPSLIGNPGTSVALQLATNGGTTLNNVTYGALANPLVLTASAITTDGRAQMDVTYVGSPTGYNIEIRDLNDAVLLSSATAVPVSSTGAGQVRFESRGKAPDAYRGGRVKLVSVEVGQPTHTVSSAATYHTTKRFGNNANGFSYFDTKSGVFKDWMRRGTWVIQGGAYAMDANTYDPIRLFNAGFLDKSGNLIKTPDGATGVQWGQIWNPDPSEINADRIFRCAPNQGLTLTNSINSNVTFNASNPLHNPAGGVYAIKFTPFPVDPNATTTTAETNSFAGWCLNFDLTKFTQNQTFSCRKDGDNTTQIITDEYVATTARLQTIRFMDSLDTNHGGIWNATNYQMNLGWSKEAIAEVVVRAAVIPYFSFGYNTTPTIAAQYMAWFEANIPTNIVPYFNGDPSNEVWGGISALLTQFRRQGIANGRLTAGSDGRVGYSGPIVVNYCPSANQSGASQGTGPIGIALNTDDYLVQGINNFSDDTLWRANRAVAATATLPTTKDGSGLLTGNADFTVVSQTCVDAASREYSVYGYDLTVAVKAVSPRMRMFINTSAGDPFSNNLGNNIFGYNSLTWPKTYGGTDSFGRVADGAMIAPYAALTPDRRARVVAAAQGSARVAMLHTVFVEQYAIAAANVAIVHNGLSLLFAQLGRTKGAIIGCYEGGPDGIGFPTTPLPGEPTNPAGLIADLRTYYRSSQAALDVQSYYDQCLAGGCTDFTTYRIGPGRMNVPGNETASFGFFDHYESLTDAVAGGAGVGAGDFATSAKYKAIAAAA